MPRGNKSAPVGRTGASFTSLNPSVGSEQAVLIVANNDNLATFCDQMFGYIEAGVTAHGGSIAVTGADFRRYCVTAIKVRIEKVIRNKWRSLGFDYTGMTVDEGWAIPAPLMDVISSIGTTRLGTGEISVYPIWDKAADVLVMNKTERDAVTAHLRSAASQLGINLFSEISKDVEGHRQTMVLVYLPDTEEWWSNEPVSREDAAANLLAGSRLAENVVRGAGGADYTLVDTEQVAAALAHIPFWMPELRMERQVVVRYLTEMAKLV